MSDVSPATDALTDLALLVGVGFLGLVVGFALLIVGVPL